MIVGVATPALLSVIFILQLGVNTVYTDEWKLVPFLKAALTGQPWLHYLLAQSNEHRPVFPHLIFLGLAYLTSYNIISEMLLGWAFLGIAVFILWRILAQTFPKGRWVIIPIAWLAYSISQYETFLEGEPSIAWYFTILMIVLAIHFLNKIKDSPNFIIPSIICGFVASFSLIIGLFVWVVGFLSFKNRSSLKLLPFYIPSAMTSFVLFFNNWGGLTVYQARASVGNPLEFLIFVLAFLGNAVRIRGDENYGISAIGFSSDIGLAVLGVFLITIFLYWRYRKNGDQNIIPWLQFAVLGLLLGTITASGRFGTSGIDAALSPRYVPLSNLFLIGTLVIALIVLVRFKSRVSTSRNKKIVKILIIVLLVFVGLEIALGDIVGLLGVARFHESIVTGNLCLLNFESASDECLQNLYPDVGLLRENAKTLRDLCLGPFAFGCK